MITQHSPTHVAAAPGERPDSTRSTRRGVAASVAAAALVSAVVGVSMASPPVDAGSSEAPSEFVPITPCRLLDTRPSSNVGPRSTPIGPGEVHIQPVLGEHGDCIIGKPVSAVAVNATAVGATAPSFATFYPGGAERPTSSNLNYLPGQAPAPNKVDVKLGESAGEIAIFNAFGSVDMVVDVVGYYRPSSEAKLQDQVDGLLRSRSHSTQTSSAGAQLLGDSASPRLSIGLQPFASGSVVVEYDLTALAPSAGDQVHCGLVQTETGPGSAIIDLEAPFVQVWESAGTEGGIAPMHGSRRFTVTSGAPFEASLLCRKDGAGVPFVRDVVLTATFDPHAE